MHLQEMRAVRMMLQMQTILVDGKKVTVPGKSFEDAKLFVLSQAWFNQVKHPKIEPIKEEIKK
jgi:hypothetical protein